jgi:hypothetical protein
MKKTKEITNKLIEELERTPLVQIACDKVGISRNTFYRWIKDDEKLFAKVNEAISLGTGLVNDVAVSNVLTGIKNKDSMYTKYWLDRKHPDFRRPFIYKLESGDYIQYQRTLNEKEQALRVEQEAKEASERLYGEKLEEAKRRLEENQDKWFVNEEVEREKYAQKFLEKWKKDHHYKEKNEK